MRPRAIDHLVLTVRDIDATIRFYRDHLGMRHDEFAPGRHALLFGAQKLNLHPAGAEFEPKAQAPTPGAIDLCLLTDTPLAGVIEGLTRAGIPIEEGPVTRTGACNTLSSIYIRDPDGNLIEIANEHSQGHP